MKVDGLTILDFGSQYTQLIARKIRELGYYAEIKPYSISFKEFQNISPKAVILSGGPASIYHSEACRPETPVMNYIIKQQIPLLGICYGMHVIMDLFGSQIAPSPYREFGCAELILIKTNSTLTKDIPAKSIVWMSHGDKITGFPDSFHKIAQTKDCEFAIISHKNELIHAIQFHPEVYHTVHGNLLLKNFCRLAHLSPAWTMKNYVSKMIKEIQEKVGNHRVLLGLSGGVDSMVTAKLIFEAIGSHLTCVYIDNGLMRNNETEDVLLAFKKVLNSSLHIVKAEKIFLKALEGVTEPESKRKIIGRVFIDEFKKKIKELGEHKFIAQGTLYPDVIESVSTKGPSDLIKSHHNRVKEVLDIMKEGKLIEPLKELFKDEVRRLGEELKIPNEVLFRHPFPGPGLAIRILGEVSQDKLTTLKQVDQILIKELKKQGFYQQVWQAFAVLLPVKSVGVMGDQRTYQNVVAIRAVESKDGMTADFAKLPFGLLADISTKIINQVRGINRVVYDISSKPPATIEWE